MDETPLPGGDTNLVVRVGDTIRRPPEPPGMRALLQWYERVGDRRQRAGLMDELIAYRRLRIANSDFRGTTPAEIIRANLRWTETHAAELATFLA